MDELIPIGDCSANDRCPSCGRHSPKRRSKSTGSGIWTFDESCGCGWSLHFENVRV